MDNEGVAFGDIFEIISEGNTEIFNYPLSIIHFLYSSPLKYSPLVQAPGSKATGLSQQDST